MCIVPSRWQSWDGVANGPGEAADADIGVACGKGSGVVFAHGKTLRKVEEAAIVDVLMEEIGNL